MPVTVKGQVTIPKPIRDRLGLTPGSRVAFEVDGQGRVFLSREAPNEARRSPDGNRVRRATGRATALEGMSTDEIMKLLRGDED